MTVTSGSVTTLGESSVGILATSLTDNVTVTSTSVTTDDENSGGIRAISSGADVTVTSGSVTTDDDDSIGILASASNGAVEDFLDPASPRGPNSATTIAQGPQRPGQPAARPIPK